MASPQLENIGLALQGFGAGLQGQGPQFAQGLQASQDRQQQMALQQQQLGLQSQEFEQRKQMQAVQMQEAQQKMQQQVAAAGYQDALAYNKFAKAGKWPEAERLASHFLQTAVQAQKQGIQVDPSAIEHAQALGVLARGAMSKDYPDEAEEARKQAIAHSDSLVEQGYAVRALERPKGESSMGKASADLQAGLITQAQFDAIAAKETSKEGGSPFLSELDKQQALKKAAAENPNDAGLKQQLADVTGHIASLIGAKENGDKPPVGYRWNKDGTLSPIAGGPADNNKQVPLGSREQVFLKRVATSANEAAKDLENVVLLPITSDTGIFGGRKQGAGLFDATKEILANKMTEEDAQLYNVMSTGFQRSLASIEAAGLMPTGTLSHQMDSVLFKGGDTLRVKMSKLAQTRQIVEAGLETALSDDRVPESEKKHLQDIVTSLQKSVPFTQKDLIRLQVEQEKDPKATLKSVMEKMQSGGEVTTQEQYDALPSGAVFTENGKKYRKP